ncbi:MULTISPECIES: homoserine kinase [Aneurinibacillus]|uniref:Homoserine kinase n=1 Tax=Aneurinibacillus thermoaerophilus TaxID=143495 RepID=A0A1G7Y9A6_ANETH|nr:MULTISPECIES: homoserine kinase [Aneurinibacillus]AMA72140.1 homoserine kinase [Aneurinibacillus sp. XH2]MED0676425.1 homoserine kinase [Aneurinibacillus thermoaerophilus]MED0736474.1 homoserine kinase [Aneurinibacillus thermoaerophilus]MED0755977.1 homoserine kinase [Aneurinibacillus thermoaerophilus]MED0763137.1 homoserine kinase [Aneurinibacillus thermoaerophilus]
MQNGKVKVKVPASTANLGPGFDTIGMAFQLYTTITLELAEETTIRLHGPNLSGIPADKSNLIYKVATEVFEKAGLAAPELVVEIASDIPLTRGLGSSASAIVGALVAANELAGRPFTKEHLYMMATEREGHPDNVGASLFGGIVVALMERENVPYVRLNVPKHLEAIAVIPEFMLSTEKSRNVLPSMYSRQDVVHTVSHTGVLVGALATGNLSLLKSAMQDVVHQPYRVPLVPGLEKILNEAHLHGALGAALSGAGPTIIAFIDNRMPVAPLEAFMVRTLAGHGVDCTVMRLVPDEAGVQIEHCFSGVTG